MLRHTFALVLLYEHVMLFFGACTLCHGTHSLPCRLLNGPATTTQQRRHKGPREHPTLSSQATSESMG